MVRKFGEDHINRSIKQIDDQTWLMGRFILRRSTADHKVAMWIDSVDSSSWSLTEASKGQLPVINTTISSKTGIDSPYIKLIHEIGDTSAVWAIGNDVICKIRFIDAGVTAESVTLDYVRKKKPSSFIVPGVLRQIFIEDRYFLLMKRLPGRTLDNAWPTLNERWKNHYINSIVDSCTEMATWKGLEIGGVDGRLLPEYFLASSDGNFSLVRQRCEALGMDCSSNPVFYHADLGPTNIIVEEDGPTSGRVGIIDFECAGFFPREWIRTKFRISSGLDLTSLKDDDVSATQWRWRVQKALEAAGFEDCVQSYVKLKHEIMK